MPTPATPQAEPLLVDLSATLNAPAIIKVIGVGGGGDNAVGHIYHQGLHDAQFRGGTAARKAIDQPPVPTRLQRGSGLGAGGNPEKGRAYALESLDAIREALDERTKMIFITAGMGGGTGTGACPVIAHEARAKGILTVGIVTIPFLFEGRVRIDKALDGVEALAAEVDALLVINNERLRHVYHDLSLTDAFARADDTLSVAVRSIVDIITMHGRMNLDFRDVETTLRDSGVAIISSATAEGTGRMMRAIREALNSPLLNDNDVYHSKHLLLSVWHSGQEGSQIMMEELDEIDEFMSHFNRDVETKYGIATDPSLGNSIKVTILASGFHVKGREQSPDELIPPVDPDREQRMEDIYGKALGQRRRHYNVCLIDLDNLDNDSFVSRIANTPTARRRIADLRSLEQMMHATPANSADTPHTITFDITQNDSE